MLYIKKSQNLPSYKLARDSYNYIKSSDLPHILHESEVKTICGSLPVLYIIVLHLLVSLVN